MKLEGEHILVMMNAGGFVIGLVRGESPVGLWIQIDKAGKVDASGNPTPSPASESVKGQTILVRWDTVVSAGLLEGPKPRGGRPQVPAQEPVEALRRAFRIMRPEERVGS